MTILDSRYRYHQNLTAFGKEYEVYSGTEYYMVAVDINGKQTGADSLTHLVEKLHGRATITPADLGVGGVVSAVAKREIKP